MTKNNLTTFWIISTLFLVSGCNDSSQSRVVLNHEFSFALPFPYEANSELFEVIHEANPDVVGFYLLDLKDIPNTPMTISCYTASEPMTLDDAFFNETVGAEPDNLDTLTQGYKLISFDHYNKAGKSLYLKVSSPIEGKCSVMYYFMKDNHSTSLYEVKVLGDMGEKERLMELSEEIALNVNL
jgi:hypothetical protein